MSSKTARLIADLTGCWLIEPVMNSSMKTRFSKCEPAVPPPPWSSISAPDTVEQPKCSRVLARTLSVIILVTDLPPWVKVLRMFDAPRRAPVFLSRNWLNLLDEKPSAWAISWIAVATCFSSSAGEVSMRLGPKFAWPATGRPCWSDRQPVAQASVLPWVGRMVT